MKTRNQFLFSGVFAALMLPVTVLAADPPRCNELFEDAQRLGCYDAVFGKPVRAGAQAAPVAPVAPTAAGSATAPVAAVAAGTAAAAATATAPAAPVAAPAPFKPPKPEAFKSSITALSSAADGRFIADLENGEQWLQSERDPNVQVKVGDAVTLQPGIFSSWTLVTKAGYAVRVKRLK